MLLTKFSKPMLATTLRLICSSSILIGLLTLKANALVYESSSKIDLALESSYTSLSEGKVRFVIKLQNQGGVLSTGVAIKDILPVNFEVLEVSIEQGSYIQFSDSLIWNVGTINSTSSEIQMTILGKTNSSVSFLINQAEISEAFEEDLDSTPDNQNLCEDDITFSTVSTEVFKCSGNSVNISLNLSPAYSIIKWHKNGQVIIEENTNKLELKSEGAYTFSMSTNLEGKTCTYFSKDTFSLKDFEPIEFETQIGIPTCGLNDGMVNIQVIKGNKPILYSEDNVEFISQNVFQNLSAGLHTFYLKDSNTCVSKRVVNLETADNNLSVTNTIQCETSGQGLVSIFVSGGTSPYRFDGGSGFQTNNTFLKSNGTHIFTVKDAKGCLTTISRLVDCQNICSDTTISFCYGSAVNQELTAPSGYKKYEWYKNDTLIIGEVLHKYLVDSPGTYTFKAIRQNEDNTTLKISGCYFTVLELAPIDFDIAIVNARCPESEKGSIEVNNLIGVNPFSFSINGGSYKSTPIFNDLDAGVYTISIRDAAGCEKKHQNQVIGVDKPTAPQISTDKLQICYSEKATLSVLGCESGDIVWSNNEINQKKIQVGQGVYYAKCSYPCGVSLPSDTIQIELIEEKTPIISVSRTSSCAGEYAILTGSGCNAGVIWNTNENTNSIKVNTPGTYTLTCLNACENTQESITVQINVLPEPVAPIIKANTLILSESQKATLSASTCNTGRLKWNTGDTLNSIKVEAGIYYAWCADKCKESKSSNQIEIKAEKVDAAPIIVSSKNTVCGKESVILNATGCNGNAVVWSNGERGQEIIIKPLLSATYSAVCLNSDSTFSQTSNQLIIEVKTPQKPILSCVKDRICEGDSVQIIAKNCSGEVVWSTGQKGALISLQPKLNAAYTAVCLQETCQSETSDTLCIEVGPPNPPFIYCNKNTFCVGDSIILTAKDCLQNVVWSNGKEGEGLSIIASYAGEYQYTATCKSETGYCTSTISNTIKITIGEVPSAPSVNSSLKNICPFETVDLNRAIIGKPSVNANYFEFHASNLASSPIVSSPANVAPGNYYLFEKTEKGCYSTPAKVNVSLDSCSTFVDINITKTADTNHVALGHYVTYHILVENLGEATATNVIIRDTLPAGLEIYLISPEATYSNRTVFAHIPELKYKESKTITFQTKVVAEGKITNTASLWMVDQPDSRLQNNISSFIINDEIAVSEVGLSKELISIEETETNVFNLLFKFNISNTGNQKITNLQLVDQLDVTFDSTVNILESSIEIPANSSITVNPNFTGKLPNINLLIDSLSSLNKADTASILLRVKIDLSNTETCLFFNTAKVFNTKDTTIYDYSTDGNNPDPDNNDDPKDNTVPTKIEIIRSQPFIGIATSLAIVDTARIDDYTFRVDYMVLVKNRTNDVLNNVILTDNLVSYFPSGSEFSVLFPPIVSVSSSLVSNVSFNGKTNIALTSPASFLKSSAQDTVFFAVIIKHKNISGPYNNQVLANAQNAEAITFSDRSNNGREVIAFKDDTTTFNILVNEIYLGDLIAIPEGFSPNDDGKNDTFKITLLAGAQLEYINLFNRWGAKIFTSDGSTVDMQAEGWNGKINTGIEISSESGVPDGTYFYEIKLKNIKTPFIGFLTVAR